MERNAGSSPARGSYGTCIFFIVFCSPSAEGDVITFHAACEGRVFFVELFELINMNKEEIKAVLVGAGGVCVMLAIMWLVAICGGRV